MDDRTSFDLPGEGRAPDPSDRAARWRPIARGVLALVVGAAVMWALLVAAMLGFFALAVRHGPSLWVAALLFFAAAPVIFLLGGIAARLVGRTGWRPGWLGVGAAWLHALSTLVLPLSRILTPPPGIPILPPPSPHPGSFTISIPGWALLGIVLPLFAYGGDRLICHPGRVRRQSDARRNQPM